MFPPAHIPAKPDSTDWPEVGAVVLDDVATFELTVRPPQNSRVPQVVVTVDHRRRIKILSEAGLRHAKVELVADGLSEITNIYARSVSRSGRISDMPISAISARGDVGFEKRAPQLKTLAFTIPDAQVGGLIEYRYTRAYADVDFVPPWLFGDGLPALRSEVSVLVPEKVSVEFRTGQGATLTERLPLRRAHSDKRTRYVFVERNVPAFFPEPHMGDSRQGAWWLAIVATAARDASGAARRLETWSDVAKRLRTLQQRVGEAAMGETPVQIYERVRDTVWGVDRLGLGVLPPQDANALKQGDPACSRDAAALLHAALERAGVQSMPVYFASPKGPPLIDGLPAVFPFVRAGVGVKVEEGWRADAKCQASDRRWQPICQAKPGDWLFLDPLCRACTFGELPAALLPARILGTGGAARWRDEDGGPPTQNRLRAQWDLSLSVRGQLTGSLSAVAMGSAAHEAREMLSRGRHSQAEAASLIFSMHGEREVLNNPRLSSVELPEQPLTVKAEVELQLDKLGYERFRFRPGAVLGHTFPNMRELRRYAAHLGHRRRIEHQVTISMPVGYDVSMQPQARVDSPFGVFELSSMREDRAFSLVRKLTLEKPSVSVDEWPMFYDFLQKIRALDEMAIELFVRHGD